MESPSLTKDFFFGIITNWDKKVYKKAPKLSNLGTFCCITALTINQSIYISCIYKYTTNLIKFLCQRIF